MLTVLGLNEKPGPTCTSKIVLVADGAPLAAGWPCSSTMRKNALFGFVEFARFWPDSALIKIPMAKMATSQKINRAAFDNFILLLFFYAPAFRISLCRNAAGALRSSAQDNAQQPAKNASRIFKQRQQNLSNAAKKGNRSVTSEVSGGVRVSDVAVRLE